ncbi:MAG TPA: hypothetical protein EYM77_00340 [Dehalococcoidia bacterium]|mgnify:CR=1 FL=1|jgi:hypothetical protein|nr:hypothetical protein [Dehalococcoidia bacterium]
MAGKARRAATRQGQLKRKKNVKGPSGIPTGRRVSAPVAPDTTAAPAGVEEADYDDSPEEIAAAEAAVSPQPARPSPAARTPRGEFAGQGQGRLRGERPAAYLYVGSEFRRILVLTSAMVAALVVLGIIL